MVGFYNITKYVYYAFDEDEIKKLLEAGCKEWEKYGKHRIYIDPEIVGFDCSYYNTGNVSAASLNGQIISNSEYKRSAAVAFIDLNDKDHSIYASTDRRFYIDALNHFLDETL